MSHCMVGSYTIFCYMNVFVACNNCHWCGGDDDDHEGITGSGGVCTTCYYRRNHIPGTNCPNYLSTESALQMETKQPKKTLHMYTKMSNRNLRSLFVFGGFCGSESMNGRIHRFTDSNIHSHHIEMRERTNSCHYCRLPLIELEYYNLGNGVIISVMIIRVISPTVVSSDLITLYSIIRLCKLYR